MGYFIVFVVIMFAASQSSTIDNVLFSKAFDVESLLHLPRGNEQLWSKSSCVLEMWSYVLFTVY